MNFDQPYFHAYNRGANKAPIFHDKSDYERMQMTLYHANSVNALNFKNIAKNDVYKLDREETLVDIIAYCLMPNHIHITLKYRLPQSGASRSSTSGAGPDNFIQKLMTSYTKYYNIKYDHSGTIWQGTCKQKPVLDENQLNTLIDYIHLNPYGIKEPNMNKGARAEHRLEAIGYSKNYEYSSYQDYLNPEIFRSQKAILESDFLKFNFTEVELQEKLPPQII